MITDFMNAKAPRVFAVTIAGAGAIGSPMLFIAVFAPVFFAQTDTLKLLFLSIGMSFPAACLFGGLIQDSVPYEWDGEEYEESRLLGFAGGCFCFSLILSGVALFQVLFHCIDLPWAAAAVIVLTIAALIGVRVGMRQDPDAAMNKLWLEARIARRKKILAAIKRSGSVPTTEQFKAMLGSLAKEDTAGFARLLEPEHSVSPDPEKPESPKIT